MTRVCTKHRSQDGAPQTALKTETAFQCAQPQYDGRNLGFEDFRSTDAENYGDLEFFTFTHVRDNVWTIQSQEMGKAFTTVGTTWSSMNGG